MKKIMLFVIPGVLLILATVVPGFNANVKQAAASEPQQQHPEDFKAAFAQLKRLEGDWDETSWDDGGYGRVVQYRLTGKGSALIEEFVGDPPMTTVYHLDGDNLRMTHYCNAGNQPRMKAASYKNNTLKFDFVDVTNLSAPNAYHTRTLDIVFHDEDHVDLGFVGLKDGKAVPGTISLTRRHPETSDP
jgi:hypothetical protein